MRGKKTHSCFTKREYPQTETTETFRRRVVSLKAGDVQLTRLLLLLLLPAGEAAAQQQIQMPPPGEARWIADPQTGCRVWSAGSAGNAAIQWNGPCPNGFAQGRGTLQWFVNGRPAWRDEGEFRDGKLAGAGIRTESDGTRYEGFWRGSKAHGAGRYISPDGNILEGFWRDGCLRHGEQRMQVGVAPTECR